LGAYARRPAASARRPLGVAPVDDLALSNAPQGISHEGQLHYRGLSGRAPPCSARPARKGRFRLDQPPNLVDALSDANGAKPVQRRHCGGPAPLDRHRQLPDACARTCPHRFNHLLVRIVARGYTRVDAARLAMAIGLAAAQFAFGLGCGSIQPARRADHARGPLQDVGVVGFRSQTPQQARRCDPTGERRCNTSGSGCRMRPRLTRVFGSSKAPATLGSQMRNSHRARKRGWITTSTSAAELSVSANANNQSRTL